MTAGLEIGVGRSEVCGGAIGRVSLGVVTGAIGAQDLGTVTVMAACDTLTIAPWAALVTVTCGYV